MAFRCGVVVGKWRSVVVGRGWSRGESRGRGRIYIYAQFLKVTTSVKERKMEGWADNLVFWRIERMWVGLEG